MPLSSGSAQLSEMGLNIPGANAQAYVMLPLRLFVTMIPVTMMFCLMLPAAICRAVYLRCVRGKPSDILKTGTYPPQTKDNHKPDMHYPSQILFAKPLDEAQLKKALLELCAGDGIEAETVSVEFMEGEPADWPIAADNSGSYKIDHYIKDINTDAEATGNSFLVWGMMVAVSVQRRCCLHTLPEQLLVIPRSFLTECL